ncbi:MAG: hypothetical protein GQF41_4616 [Candidatus Rifleibacterium amylolyticum]|nr:MAG: hypothetical protein GQF41_4616 [Candidatus Rifleibacterium amylolyticum]
MQSAVSLLFFSVPLRLCVRIASDYERKLVLTYMYFKI